MSVHGVLVTMSGYPVVPSNFMPDNGLAQLAGCLVHAGHDVTILDYNTPAMTARLFPEPIRRALQPLILTKFERPLTAAETEALTRLEHQLEAHRDATFDALGRELAEQVQRLGAGWLGFKLWNGDGFTGSERMARQVKARLPNLPIIGGGSHADFFSEYLPTIETGFDYFGIQEGELTLTEFSRFVAGEIPLTQVPNLVYRGALGPQHTHTARVEDLDSLPQAIYDSAIYPAMASPGKLRAGVVEETRGCPHRCAFCNHPLKAGHQLRVRKPASVVAELRRLKENYGLSAFKLGGSYTPSGYVRKLAEALLEDETNITFCGYGRINDARRADFDLYYRAGCRALFFGVETGSQILLDEQIDKGYQTEHAVGVLKASKAAGIYTVASLVYPTPGETEDSARATLALIAETKPDGVPVHFPLLLPGSTWWADPERYGFTVPDREKFLATSLRYKARMLFPPQFWPDMPYQIDGRSFREFAAMTADMTEKLEGLGCTPLISDDTAILGLHSGLGIRNFRDKFRLTVALGDAEAQQGLVDAVNEGLKKVAQGGPVPQHPEG